MGPQTRDMESLFIIKHKLAESQHRLQDFRVPFSAKHQLIQPRAEAISAKEKAMLQGSGSVSGSPGRIQENLSRDSGVGGLKDGLNTSGESENDIPRYISDSSDSSNYKRGKFLGKGGFARVHELIELSSNNSPNPSTTPSNTFAVKIIHKSRISKPYQLEKITREIELHRGLVHRNVVQFVKNFNDSDNIYIVLENCSNKSLVHVLKARHVVTEAETRYYLHQLVAGVEYIHSQNIIHRDLKLGNMFLTASMALKIGDFGLATRHGTEKKFTICGTPNYLSPEVLNKEGHGFPADVWALGCVMYALLVGQPPFETSTLKETYYRIAENIYTVPGSVSPSGAALIKKLLSPSPRQRPKVSVITQDPFFSSGYFPVTLPPSACRTTPVFSSFNSSSSSCLSSLSTNSSSCLSGSTTKISSLTTTLKQSTREVSRLTSSVSTLTLPDHHHHPHHDQHQLHHDQHQQQIHRAIDHQKPKLKTSTLSLYEALTNTLNSMPCKPSLSLTTTKESPVFITKWIDYSNRYGFGFQLSDKSIGVLFNDNSRISYSPDRSFIQFGEGVSVTTLGIHQVPSVLEEKFTLLQYFTQYMDHNLTEGGEARKSATRSLTNTIPQIKRWIRTPKAIIMHLTNGTIQVNYIKDHTKLIVGGETDHIVMYINSDRQTRSYFLSDIARYGASPAIKERMTYVASVLEEFSELDEQIFQIF